MGKHHHSVESFLSAKEYEACHDKHGWGDLFIKLGFARWINVFFSGQSIGRFAMPATLRGTTTSLKSFARVNKDTQESTKTSLAEPPPKKVKIKKETLG